jgi:hypothetical protein
MQCNAMQWNGMPIDEQNKILHRYRRVAPKQISIIERTPHGQRSRTGFGLIVSFLRRPAIVRIQIDI